MPKSKSKHAVSRRVIVLNASYEPLGVVPIRRINKFLMQERIEIIKSSDTETLRTAIGVIPLPVVIRFTRMVHVPAANRELQWTRRKVLERDNYECAYCDNRGTTVDHVVPVSKGGKNTWTNTVACCIPCNSKKADRYLSETGLTLRFRPRAVFKMEAVQAAVLATGIDLESLYAVA